MLLMSLSSWEIFDHLLWIFLFLIIPLTFQFHSSKQTLTPLTSSINIPTSSSSSSSIPIPNPNPDPISSSTQKVFSKCNKQISTTFSSPGIEKGKNFVEKEFFLENPDQYHWIWEEESHFINDSSISSKIFIENPDKRIFSQPKLSYLDLFSETHYLIFSFLDIPSLLNMNQTCHILNRMKSLSDRWKDLVIEQHQATLLPIFQYIKNQKSIPFMVQQEETREIEELDHFEIHETRNTDSIDQKIDMITEDAWINTWFPSIPKNGWKDYFFEYKYSWYRYVLAKKNTRQQCFIGIEGQIYDVSNFLDHHPGSAESLLAHAGQDASDIFQNVSHSTIAKDLLKQFCIWKSCPSKPFSSHNIMLIHVQRHLNKELEELMKQNQWIRQDSHALKQWYHSLNSEERDAICLQCRKNRYLSTICQFHSGELLYYCIPQNSTWKWNSWWTCCRQEAITNGCKQREHLQPSTLIPSVSGCILM